MRQTFKYGTLRFQGAKVGDTVRFVEGPLGQPGAIMQPRSPYEINGVLLKVTGDLGYVEVKTHTTQASAAGESGSAGGIRIQLPVIAGGSLKIS